MGYYVSTAIVDFYIPDDKQEEAFQSVVTFIKDNALNLGACAPTKLIDLLHLFGFNSIQTESRGLFLGSYSDKVSWISTLVMILSEFSVDTDGIPGGKIDWQGEDGEMFRWVVIDKQLFEQEVAYVIWATPVPLLPSVSFSPTT